MRSDSVANGAPVGRLREVGERPVRLSVHVYPAGLSNASRVLKMTHTATSRGLVRRVLIVAGDLAHGESHQSLGTGRDAVAIRTTVTARRGLARAVSLIEWSARVWHRLSGEPVDMVNCHTLGVLPLCVALKWRHNAVLVYEPHEHETETVLSKGVRRRFAKWIEAWLIRYADLVIVVSPSIASHYLHDYGVEDIAVVRNVPVAAGEMRKARESPLRTAFPFREGDIVFLYQGLLAGGRCVEALLEAFQRVPQDRHLVLMGFGPLEALVRSVGERVPNIHFHQAVPPEQVLDYTCGADVGLALLTDDCLNHRCALPNKLFEYLQAGVPVLVSDLDEIGAVADRFECGWRTDNTPEAIAECVSNIGSESLNRVRAGARIAGSELHWGNEAPRLEAAYAQALRRGGWRT